MQSIWHCIIEMRRMVNNSIAPTGNEKKNRKCKAHIIPSRPTTQAPLVPKSSSSDASQRIFLLFHYASDEIWSLNYQCPPLTQPQVLPHGHTYNLFKLFFRAFIFFLSTGILEAIGPSFLRAADAPTAGSETVSFWSCKFVPNALVGAEDVDNAVVGTADGAFSLKEALDWSTFRAVVDSEIAPLLDLFLGLAWIPVYNLYTEHD
jgi:hypothetical protein